jgi:hypothetical protein
MKALDYQLRQMAETYCGDLPLPLVLAVINTESDGDLHAWRAEPAYRYLWDNAKQRPFRALTQAETRSETPPADFTSPRAIVCSRTTEWWGQQASWGPMQVMGAVARELGFTAHFPEMCGALGVKLGCRYLANLARRFYNRHGWPGVVAAYNAGSVRFAQGGLFENQVYVDKIAAAGGFKHGG